MEKSVLTLRKRDTLLKVISMINFASLTNYLSGTKLVQQLQEACLFLFDAELSARQATYLFYAQLCVSGIFFPCAISFGWRAFFFMATICALKRSSILQKIKEE